MGTVEIWTQGISLPKLATRMAQRAEAAGYDGILLVDSQNLAGDCYVALAVAARDTDRIRLGTGVTNPCTRHPAVTASAIASVHAESDGRAVLGIGRGDSALAHLGMAPVPVEVFAAYLDRVQRYLAGDDVPFAADLDAPPVDTLGLAAGPTSSRLHWLRPDLAKVPVLVAATGPRVIGVAACLADRVTFAVGADPTRIGWAIERTRAARTAAGLEPDAVSRGAFVNVVVDDDLERARQIASGPMSTFARFNVMHGTTHGPMAEGTRALLGEVHDHYDMGQHTRVGSPQAELLDADFAASFAILGPPEVCVEKLHGLAALGLDHLVVVGPGLGADPDAARAAEARFVAEVLPALRAG